MTIVVGCGMNNHCICIYWIYLIVFSAHLLELFFPPDCLRQFWMNYRRSGFYQYGDFSGLIMSNYRVTWEKGLSLLSFQRLSWKVLCWMGSLSRGTWMLECGLLTTKALASFLVLREMQRNRYLPFSLLKLLYCPAHPLSSLSDLSPISSSFPLLPRT